MSATPLLESFVGWVLSLLGTSRHGVFLTRKIRQDALCRDACPQEEGRKGRKGKGRREEGRKGGKIETVTDLCLQL